MLDANKKLLDKAIKEEYITAKWTEFSVSGAPETGKSSFLKLLYNEDPPAYHDSTSVVAACERRKGNIIPTILATADDNSEWTKINHRCLTEMIAQVIKNCIKRLKRPQSMIGNQETRIQMITQQIR